MLRYALKRLLGAIPTLLLVIVLAFLMVHAAPGGPFDDERVRMAVSHAIDREGLVSAIQRGYGTPVAGIFIPQTFGFDPCF